MHEPNNHFTSQNAKHPNYQLLITFN